MTTYCFVCPECGHAMEAVAPVANDNGGPWLCVCMTPMRRDWQAENATFTRVPGGARA